MGKTLSTEAKHQTNQMKSSKILIVPITFYVLTSVKSSPKENIVHDKDSEDILTKPNSSEKVKIEVPQDSTGMFLPANKLSD